MLVSPVWFFKKMKTTVLWWSGGSEQSIELCRVLIIPRTLLAK